LAAEFSVTAILAAYNEEDIVGQVVGDLVQQGIRVYLLDHASTDATVEEARRSGGPGLIGVERLAGEVFSLEAIVKRKAELAAELEGSWFINQDADEFREGPWTDCNLFEAIRRVDTFGYNAIDFEVLNFWPTHDHFRKGDDVRAAFTCYEQGGTFDRLQIRCWKRVEGPFDLVSSAGHEVAFEGRRVFPLRFLLRHYPVRSQAHGERKVFAERRPRFAEAERQRGWHVQYDRLEPGHHFVRDPATLRPYDPHQARLQLALRHRGVEELEATLAEQRGVEQRLRSDLAARVGEVLELNGQLARRSAEKERLDRDLEQRGREVEELQRDLERRGLEVEELQRGLERRGHEIEELQRHLEQRSQEKQQLDRDLEARGAEVGALQKDLEQRGREVETLNRDLAQRSREKQQLDGALDERSRALAAAQQALAAAHEERLRLEAEGESLAARLRQLESSLSWRLTAPLRSLLDRLRS
jgi:hypothetical protein